MFKIEKKIIEFLERHYIILSVIFVTIIALLIRYSQHSFASGDYLGGFEKWIQYFRTDGGFKAIAHPVGDYNIPYLTLVALVSYLPFSDISSIKLICVFFDIVLAITSVLIARELLKDKKDKKYYNFTLLLVYMAVINLPTVFLNSGMWGQCDSIYVSFMMLAILFLLKKKDLLAFIMLGISFAFKLQFIFALPIFIILYVSEKRYSILNFAIIPLMNIVLSIPALIAGYPFKDLFQIYVTQVHEYPDRITMNIPNIYNLMGNFNVQYLYTAGILFTLLVCFAMLIYIIYKKVKWNNEKVITLILWFLVIIPYLLPGMHERYLYAAEVFVTIYYIIYRKNLPLLCVVLLSPILTYFHYLSNNPIENMQLITIIFGVINIYFTKYVVGLLAKE